jgi:hypothetical protein
MLLIGNAMNQGSRKEEVSGFTLDSLLKIISMKGTVSPHLTTAATAICAPRRSFHQVAS